MISSDDIEVVLSTDFWRVYLFFAIVQSPLLLTIAGAVWYVGDGTTTMAVCFSLATVLGPLFTTIFARSFPQLGAGEDGIYLKAPRSISELHRWEGQLIEWDRLDEIIPSCAGFKIKSSHFMTGLLPPFCFTNWKAFETLQRRHRPEFFKD